MTVNITIDGDGLSLKKETSLQKAGQIIAFLGMEEGTIGPINKQNSNQPSILPSTATLSPKELINEAKAKTNAQKIAVIGKYLSEKDAAEGFLIKEIQLQLRKMGEEPGNFTRDLKTAISSQYLYEIDTKEGRYGVSEKGLEEIHNKFKGDTPKIGIKKGGGFKKAIPPRDEVNSLITVTTMEGYPNFHDLPTKADSILWVLTYADSQKIVDLTPKEIEVITDKMLNKIPQNAFSAHNKRNIKKGFVALTDGRFKMQQKGLDHLKGINPKDTHDKE